MKRLILIIVFLNIAFYKCYSQGEEIMLHIIESSYYFEIKNTCVDKYNNIYITGKYKGSVYFQNDTMSNPTNSYRMFVCKFNSNGFLDWIFEDANATAGLLIKPDNNGNLIVMGSGLATGGTPLGHYYTHFILKISNQGQHKWVSNFDATYYHYPMDIAIDKKGNTYLTGSFSRSIYFGINDSLTSTNYTGGREIFLAKLDSSGNFVWAKKAGKNKHSDYLDNDDCHSVCTDHDGNVYIAGSYKNICVFPLQTIFTSGKNIFIAKYDSLGNNLLVKHAKRHSIENSAYHILCNADSTISLFGSITGNGYLFSQIFNLSGFGSSFYIANFDKNLNENWVQLIGKSFPGNLIAPNYELFNSDPVTSNGYYLTTKNETISNFKYNGLILYKMDSKGQTIYSKEISESIDYFQDLRSLNINNMHESIIVSKITDATIIGNTTYTLNHDIAHFIFKITHPSNNIKGRVFIDSNQNGNIDSNELGVENAIIKLLNKDDYEITDSLGYFNYHCDTGFYQLSMISDSNCTQTFPINPYFYSINLSSDSLIVDSVDFGIACINTSSVFEIKPKRLSIFPNPTSGKFEVDISNYESIDVLNSFGQTLLSTTKRKIDISSFSEGLYIIRINTGKEIFLGKVIKQN